MQAPERSKPNDPVVIAQLALSGLGMAFSLLAAALLIVIGLVGIFSESIPRDDTTALFSLAWVCLLTAGLAAPSLYLSIQRLRGLPSALPPLNAFRMASLSLLVWPLALAAGNLLAGTAIAWLLLPPLQLLAFGLPVWWLVEAARRNLPMRTAKRGWGLLNFSMFLTTPTVIVFELLVIAGLFVVFVFWLTSQPDRIRELEVLRNSLERVTNLEEILEITRPFIQNPITILSALIILGGVMPMLEELLKPLAMWLLIRQRMSPAEGFAAGAICGGSFALLESLLNISGPTPDGWALVAVGRAGTALLHITTTALIGWALASAWERRSSWKQLVLTYLLSVALHGVWNMLSVLSGLAGIVENPPESIGLFVGLSRFAPIGIVILVLILFVLLWGSNRRLQQENYPAERSGYAAAYSANYRLESTTHGNDPRPH